MAAPHPLQRSSPRHRSRPASPRRPLPHYPRPISTPLADIIKDLTALLEPDRFADYGPNGLQVPGAATVTTVVTGVSAQLELFERARAENAELVVVHHGLFWGSGPGPIDRALARRLKVLLGGDISLLAYHLPLDAHPAVGNNALLARALQADPITPFAPHRGTPIGFLAQLPGEGVPIAELLARVEQVTDRPPLSFLHGPPLVRRLGIVSGGGASHLDDAVAAGADAFLTGEPSEQVMAQARETGVHFIAAGHYATETFGVRRLGERLAERFGVRHLFVDIPNPV
ncbi:MAG TPA: Nif3-like dinuclear metal center hexameric protein [Solirubrobacteraceae bacterium]|jgi:dinuclear metal center YbgI/SA1388 family protein|nr:Nif3-like dinuclear metal center hexameric protein [Solirubrobacteraceae bacterium]